MHIGAKGFIMKYFIVNVNNCLMMSQYAPFFYEHIYNGDLVMLDDIEDTCQLDRTYQQLVSHLNRNPFAYKKSVIMLFIRRDLNEPLQAQHYELYNDINTYTHLLRNLSNDFKVYTIYVDRTSSLGKNDAVYQQLKAVNQSLQANCPELMSHFLSLECTDADREGSYKSFLRNRISRLCECTREFYLQMLNNVSDTQGSPAAFQNGLNHYIGEARKCLSEVNHISAPVYWLNLAQQTQQWIKLIYYIKDTIHNKQEPMDYTKYTFDRFDEVRRLIATYRKRLSAWTVAAPPIPEQGSCYHREFRKSGNAAAEYHNKINTRIDEEIKKIGGDKSFDKTSVEKIFDQLHRIMAEAKGDLQDFGKKQSDLLLDPDNYQKVGENEFDLKQDSWEDRQAEEKALEKLNKPFGAQAQTPDFSAENLLEQELDVCNNYIQQVIRNLDDYKMKYFIWPLLFALVAVAGIYCGSQYSIFIKENSWWIFGAYLAAVGVVFSTAYFTVRHRYNKEIEKQIKACKDKVTDFMNGYKEMATAFEANTLAAGQYNCLKQELEEKRAAREAYRIQKQQYAWHKMRVEQILRDLTFFDGFVGNASPCEESNVTFDSFAHDPEHTEFYLMKVFRR